MPSLIDFEYHRPGKDTTVYREWLVAARPDVKVLLLEEYDGRDVEAGGMRILDASAPIVWYVFPDAWYDVGRFHLADGTLTGWYTNFSTPVQFDDARWIGHDLFLDLWQPIDGDPLWLDEDEFEAARRSGLIDPRTSRRVQQERLAIERRLDEGRWPPAIARTVSLADARSWRDGR